MQTGVLYQLKVAFCLLAINKQKYETSKNNSLLFKYERIEFLCLELMSLVV